MLLPKPDACHGCPLYGNGQGFTPDAIIPGAEVCVMAQNPGVDEEQGRKLVGYQGKEKQYEPHPHEPLLGVTGYDMDRKFLPLAGLGRSQVSLTNAFRCRIRGSNDVPTADSPVMRQAIQYCQRAHFKPQNSTKLYVAMGDHALWALTGEMGITDWRGWLLPYAPAHEHAGGFGWAQANNIYRPPTLGIKGVLATYHLAYLYRAPWDRPVAQRDWQKIRQILDGEWPKPLPPIDPFPPVTWPARSAFDTEFVPDTRYWLRYSLATATTVHVVERPEHSDPWHGLPYTPTVVMHNALADIPYLDRLLPAYTIEDTMYKHAALWPDLEHKLGFLGSLYASINRWKHLEYRNQTVYSAGDAWATREINEALDSELYRAPKVEHTYYTYRLPLVHIIMKSLAEGIKVHQANTEAALHELHAQCQDARILAQAAVGWPLNIGSPAQVKEALYGTVNYTP